MAPYGSGKRHQVCLWFVEAYFAVLQLGLRRAAHRRTKRGPQTEVSGRTRVPVIYVRAIHENTNVTTGKSSHWESCTTMSNNNVPNDCWLTKVQSSALRSYHSINALAQSPALAILALVRTWSALKFPAMLSKVVCSLSFSLKGEQLCMMLLRHALMEIH